MTRDQFIRRVSDVLQRSDVSDAALLVRMLEVNCFGSPHSAEDGASTVTLSWNDITPALAKRDAAIEETLVLLRSDEPSCYIRAIKLYRELTGDGLADSKRTVDQLMTAHKINRHGRAP